MNGADLLAIIVNSGGLGGALLDIAVMATLPRPPADRAHEEEPLAIGDG